MGGTLVRIHSRSDFTQLVNMGLLSIMKENRGFVYNSVHNLKEQPRQF